jgi:glycosyltransferase involved in cell wall biosynthesis
MRIWFAAGIPKDSKGGVNMVMHAFSKNLKACGHDCRIIYSKRFSNYLLFAIRLLFLFIFAHKKPDFIIARSTDGFLCALFKRLLLLKTKVILHSHGWEEKAYEIEKKQKYFPYFPKSSLKAILFRFNLLKFTLYLSDFCLCGTLEEARWIKTKYKKYSKKIVCIPNGVYIKDLFIREWRNFQPLKFISVGSLTWKKNIIYTINIFHFIKISRENAELHLIGCSYDNLIHFIDERLLKGIKAISFKLPEDMQKEYRECPYFISSSSYEGGRSLAILEAMANSCIVFVSPIPSSLEFIKNEENGIVLSLTDPAEDAEKILKVIDSPDLCEKISKKAYSFTLRHSWLRQSLRFERLLCSKF